MRITFAGPLISTFVSNDLKILRSRYDVRSIDVNLGSGSKAAWRLLILHLRLVVSLLDSDALFFWFADYYTLLPSLVARLLRKKVFVVAGGFDITYLPELGIGARTRPVRWFAVRNTFKAATHIFTVSKDTQNDLDSAVPSHSPSTMIYNAVDTSLYRYNRIGNNRIALTVSQADSPAEYLRKGIDRFLELAPIFPEVEFHLVGVRGAVVSLAQAASSKYRNVTVRPGRVPIEDLLDEFWKAQIYIQLSVEERFGVSVAEAMSCGCIPIVSPVNALMEVVEGVGYIVDRDSEQAIRSAVESAFSVSELEHARVSQAAHKFDISERAHQLLEVLDRHLPS